MEASASDIRDKWALPDEQTRQCLSVGTTGGPNFLCLLCDTRNCLTKRHLWDFPGIPVVKILPFPMQGAQVQSLIGETMIPHAAVWYSQKKRKRERHL